MGILMDHLLSFHHYPADLLDAADHCLPREPADPWQGVDQGSQLLSAEVGE